MANMKLGQGGRAGTGTVKTVGERKWRGGTRRTKKQLNPGETECEEMVGEEWIFLGAIFYWSNCIDGIKLDKFSNAKHSSLPLSC